MAKNKRIIQWALLAVSVVLIAAGFIDNGFREVMTKAVMICMECIGIG